MPLFALVSTGRELRSLLNSASSLVIILVTLTICCLVTASTEPNCCLTQDCIGGGVRSSPTAVVTAYIRRNRAFSAAGKDSTISFRAVIPGLVTFIIFNA